MNLLFVFILFLPVLIPGVLFAKEIFLTAKKVPIWFLDKSKAVDEFMKIKAAEGLFLLCYSKKKKRYAVLDFVTFEKQKVVDLLEVIITNVKL